MASQNTSAAPPLNKTGSDTMEDWTLPAVTITGSVAVIVFGASGDLAKKKVLPVLWNLFRDKFVPEVTKFYGYARSELTAAEVIKKFRGNAKVQESENELFEKFSQHFEYVQGGYDKPEDFKRLNDEVSKWEAGTKTDNHNRIFYLAIPPGVYPAVTENVKHHCWTTCGFNRVILEKPFGRDLPTSDELQAHLSTLLQETEIYRIDHYLGKEMVQNIMSLRFANRIFLPVWNRDHIANVQITMKEPFGTGGRGGYFDDYGIIRDVMQNHLLQCLCMIAMEKPLTTSVEDIRLEKTKVLRAMRPLRDEDVIIGQYVASKNPKTDEAKIGYRDQGDVPKDSNCPTFATAAFFINNERWEGVPFILRCGKALNEQKAEIRIQFKEPPGALFQDQIVRNELVMRIQPKDAVYLKLMVKKPGHGFECSQTELDLTYQSRFKGVKLPDAYERLILDVLRGSQVNFVGSEELREAWRIFTPVLHLIDDKKKLVSFYEYGTRGVPESDDFIKRFGYRYTQYDWPDA